MDTPIATNIIEIDFNSLNNDLSNLSNEIEMAFGEQGLGILLVYNVPNIISLRTKLLSSSFHFANLPESVKSKYLESNSLNSFGWSSGTENFKNKIDIKKGSYYANPQYDALFDYPSALSGYGDLPSNNIWPKHELPDFEHSFKELGKVIVDVGILVAKQCDIYVSQRESSYSQNILETYIKESYNNKGRLLHYFPLDHNEISNSNSNTDSNDWCGLHNDHSCLTGLTSPMYMNPQGEEIEIIDQKAGLQGEEIEIIDQKAGLYIHNRQGEIIHAKWSNDKLAFQIGETAQILSGGYLKATPHGVRATTMAGVSREQFAMFMQPNFNAILNYPSHTEPQSSLSNQLGLPSLSKRFKDGDNFAEFTRSTVSKYY